jgi:hypothetical protein
MTVLAEIADKMLPAGAVFYVCTFWVAGILAILAWRWRWLWIVGLPLAGLWGALYTWDFLIDYASIVRELGVGYVRIEVSGAFGPLLVLIAALLVQVCLRWRTSRHPVTDP